MNNPAEKASTNSPRTGLWYQTAVQTAIVAGLFSAVVGGLLVFNYVQRIVFDAARTEELDRLKIEIVQQPDDEALKSTIRQLDLRVRQDRIRRWDFARKGTYLLLAGLVAFLVGAKLATTLRKKLPLPQARADDRQRQLRQAMCARRAVAAALIVFALASLLLIATPTADFSSAGEAPAAYPSRDEINRNWPRFRGPGGLGISAYTNVPTKWNGKTGDGILWKTKVPLTGHNSPVVWEDRVFLSGADEHKREVYCFDASTGELLWQQPVEVTAPASAEPLEPMEDTGFAAPTLATDGRRVCAIFANGDVACFDFKGRRLWARNLGTPESPYGYASSLAMYRNLVLIQYDQASADDGKSRLIALNVFSGDTVWQTQRSVAASWTSPIVIRVGGQDMVITASDPFVMAHDPATGAEIWRAECLGTDLAPSPIYAGGLVLAIEPHVKLVAIRPDGRADVTKTHIAWFTEESAPDIPTPVSNGEYLFVLETGGTLTCQNVSDGEVLWGKDLDTYFQPSPSMVGGLLYLLSDKGVMFIAETTPEYKEVGRCELGEDCRASPAFADGRIYIRGMENLYCIGAEPAE